MTKSCVHEPVPASLKDPGVPEQGEVKLRQQGGRRKEVGLGAEQITSESSSFPICKMRILYM